MTHARPPGVDDATVAAVGKLTEAIEWLERARGRLYDFHQMVGHLDAELEVAVGLLRAAGHEYEADLIEREAIGRDVLEGRWTFQVVEQFDGQYYEPVKAIERQIGNQLVAGRRHVFEAELKASRRTPGPSSGGGWPATASGDR